MAKASISRAWEESKQVLAGNSRILSSVALALIILPATVLATIAPKLGQNSLSTEPVGAALSLVVMLIGLVARITIARVALRSREVLSSAIRVGVERMLPVVGAGLLFIVPVGLLLSPFLPQIVESPRQPPPTALAGVTAVLTLALIFGARLLTMLVPAAAVEPLNPIALLKRSWALTKGNWLRLIGFVFLFYIGLAIASRAVIFVIGGGLLLVSGPLQPLSLPALVLALALATVSAMFVTVFSVMLARIYVQLAGPDHAATSVPTSVD